MTLIFTVVCDFRVLKNNSEEETPKYLEHRLIISKKGDLQGNYLHTYLNTYITNCF